MQIIPNRPIHIFPLFNLSTFLRRAVADRRKRSRRSSSAQSPTAATRLANGGAVSADVTSANTVGYVTSQVANGYYKTFSVTLTDVANPAAPVRVDKLFTIDTIKNVTAWGDSMDQIWRWDTTGNQWVKYGYQKPRSGGTAAWRKCNYETDKSFSDLTDADAVQPGETFLYYRGGDATATLTLSGQVKELGQPAGYTIANGFYQFIAYPWPVALKLSDVMNLATFSTIKTVTAWGDSMDQIWRWDAVGNQWLKYGYQKPRSGGTAAWRKCNYETDKSFSELTDADKIEAGEGFLYYRGGDETLTLTWKPLQSAE